MIDENNPAGRLHKILTEIKALPGSIRALDAWSMATDSEKNDLAVTLTLVDLYNLSQQVQALIKLHDAANSALYLKSFQTIDRAFSAQNLGLSIQTIQALITDEALTRLQFCAEALSKAFPENPVHPSQLEKAIKMADKLRLEIDNAELPATLKWMLLEQNEKVKRSITAYPVKGAKGLKESSNCMLGTVVSMNERLNRMDDKLLLKNIGELIKFLDQVASSALRIKPIPGPIDSLMPRAPVVK